MSWSASNYAMEFLNAVPFRMRLLSEVFGRKVHPFSSIIEMATFWPVMVLGGLCSVCEGDAGWGPTACSCHRHAMTEPIENIMP